LALRTAEQYRESLKDGRTVYFRGKRVDDVTKHPVIGIAVEHASIDYEMADDPAHRQLAVVAEGPGAPYSRYYKIPTSADDLLKRSALIEQATALGNTLVVLIKEIGTDALFGLHQIAAQMDAKLGTGYLPRVQRFYEHCRDEDLALAVAQTDVKGDRSRGPADQEHPDYYVRIVERRDDGIVVRGAKCHTSVSTNANELIVLPTRAMSEADSDYAVAFAVPMNTPGLKLLASPYGSSEQESRSEFEFPITARHKMMETTTVFDDVFVPWERVFLAGEYQYAGPLALAFVEFHRFTAISYKLPLVDALVGGAQLMADYNGISRAAHVRDKLIALISYAETLRGLTHHAALRSHSGELGFAVPDALTVNMAKYHFAHHYHEAVAMVQDISGGSLVTGPGAEDVESEEIGRYFTHYYGGRTGVNGRERLQAINFVKDLTSSDYGGYQEVLAIHAEGSLEAEKLMIARAYDSKRTLSLVRRMAQLDAAG
jgi:4-hydroxybutyryl-CoA dehydratase/vinylacetyl-CoA-Delta-isomerase